MKTRHLIGLLIALIALFLPLRSSAAELIVNGGFETGNFSGWTATNAIGGFENWAVTGSGNGSVFSPVPVATSVVQGSFNAWNSVAASAGGTYLLFQTITIPAGNSVQLRWQHRYQMNLATFCSGAACGTATFAVEVLNTSNVLLQTLYTITTPNTSNTNTGWTTNIGNLSAYAGQTIRIRFRTVVSATLQGPGRIEIDGVSANAFVPTAADAVVGGRVLSNRGNGISRVNVTLTNGAGVSRSVTTNSFGYYRFDEVEVGQTYILAVKNKRYLFPDSPRVVNIQNDVADIDFVASP